VTPLEHVTNELEQALKRWRAKGALAPHRSAAAPAGPQTGEPTSTAALRSLAVSEGAWEVVQLACPLLGVPGDANPTVHTTVHTTGCFASL
jgi:hypothetical protein